MLGPKGPFCQSCGMPLGRDQCTFLGSWPAISPTTSRRFAGGGVLDAEASKFLGVLRLREGGSLSFGWNGTRWPC